MQPVRAWLAGKPPRAASETALLPAPLLESAVQVLISIPVELVAGTTVSQPVSSAQEGELLKASANRLAAKNGLDAWVRVTDGRLRVRFTRRSAERMHDGAPK